MGAGIYIVWPAFYTDVTDAYRLDRTGRLRTDLGGVYFNSVFILVVIGAYAVIGYEPLLLFVPLQLVEMIHQFLPFLRLDGYYILADATGVPDMFGRIKPILRSVVFGREPDARAEELKPWARRVVTTWVVLLIPVLIVMFGLMALSAPRVVSTAWDSLGNQWDALSTAWDAGDVFGGSWAAFQAAILALPAAGLVASFNRIGARSAAGAWSATEERPVARMLLGAGGTATAALLGLWLIGGNYSPIQPDERGTIGEAVAVAGHATQSAVDDPLRSRPSGSADSKPGDRPREDGASTPAGSASGGTEGSAGTDAGDQGSTPSDGSGAPVAPTGLTADAGSQGVITLTWSAPAGATGIAVQRGDGTACPTSTSSGTPIGGQTVRTSQSDTTVTDGQSYCYAVFTLAAHGSESPPATVQATAAAAEPSGGSTATAP